MKKLFLLLITFGLLYSFNTSTLYSQNEEEYYDDDEYYEDDGEKKPDVFIVGLQAGYKLSLGDFATFYGNTFGIFGLVEVKVMKSLGIGLKFGYLSWVYDDPQDEERIYRNFPLNLTLFYYFKKSKSLQAYAGIETGMNFITFIKKRFEYPSQNQRITIRELDITYEKIGFAPTVGAIVPFGGINMNFNVKYFMLFADIPNINYIGINAGLSYGL